MNSLDFSGNYRVSECNMVRYSAPVKGVVVEIDWTSAADTALAAVDAVSEREAAERLRVSASTIRRWRHLREAGEEIPEPRGTPRKALLRFVRSTTVHETVRAPYTVGETEAEEYLAKIVDPQLLRRIAGTPTLRDVIIAAKAILVDRSWPLETKNAVDALLNRMLEDANPSRD